MTTREIDGHFEVRVDHVGSLPSADTYEVLFTRKPDPGGKPSTSGRFIRFTAQKHQAGEVGVINYTQSGLTEDPGNFTEAVRNALEIYLAGVDDEDL